MTKNRDTEPREQPIPRVAIVGAGMAGLACARTLKAAGIRAIIFEKSRGPGGRVATRREEEVGTFDHGAAFFTARAAVFSAWVDEQRVAGNVATFVPQYAVGSPASIRWVGTPGMNALGRQLAAEQMLRTACRIDTCRHESTGWWLSDDAGSPHGPYEALVVAVPAPQAIPLLAGAPALADRAGEARFSPCWAVMAGWDERLHLPFDVYEGRDTVLSWVAREGAKPGRPAGERWVLHATEGWSQRHLEEPPDDVIAGMLAAFTQLAAVDLPPPTFVKAHRWRYARVVAPLGVDCLYDESLHVIACGDWCRGARIEDAFESGVAAGERLLQWLAP